MPAGPFESWSQLAEFGIDYRAPYDIAANPELGPVDAFVSNEVFEHIPPGALRDILRASRTFLRAGGLSIHSIDYSDHYARGGNVSRYNFLTYDDAEWRAYDSRFQYVNRLRHSEYLGLHDDAGLEVVDVETYSEELPAAVSTNLADRFRGYGAE